MNQAGELPTILKRRRTQIAQNNIATTTTENNET
jgi:hypothetical protein